MQTTPEELTERLLYLAGYVDALRHAAPEAVSECGELLGLSYDDVSILLSRLEVEAEQVDCHKPGLRAKRSLLQAVA